MVLPLRGILLLSRLWSQVQTDEYSHKGVLQRKKIANCQKIYDGIDTTVIIMNHTAKQKP